MNAPYLLGLGFIVGISGAIIPGPLLVYTISQTLRRGPLTGFYVILGHAIVEVAVTILLLFGLESLIQFELILPTVSIIGGSFMLYTAYTLCKSNLRVERKTEALTYGTITGGMIFTAFNPSFPIWWASAGARLILEGLRDGGTMGAILVLLGHWGADLGYFLLISHLVHHGKEKLAEGYANKVKTVLAVLLAAIGIYFLRSGFSA